MGAAHSRRKPGAGVQTGAKLTFGANHPPPKSGYFILSLKSDKIKVVNAEPAELKLLTVLIKKHCKILKEGWDRHLTYSYKLKLSGCQCLIQLVADTLMSLYHVGWEPMTPIEMGMNRHTDVGCGPRTDICFRKKELPGELMGSTYSLITPSRDSNEDDNSCLCLETFDDNYLGFHNVANTVLQELVTTIQEKWSPGISGVSMGVASVIQDYTSNMPPVLPITSDSLEDKFVKLEGHPWTFEPQEGKDLEDAMSAEKLQIAIIACLSKEGYKLSMDINMEANTRVFFLIKNLEDNKAEVRVPNNAGAGLGEKETLSVYRPMLIRHKSSFFRSYHGKTASFRNKIRASLRRKAMSKQGRQDTVMSYKPVLSEPAWWQQTSTDVFKAEK